MSTTDKLRNVGPKSAAWLRQVGVRTQGDLEELGAVAAFIKVKRAGFRPSLNLLYALEGALLGCHWQQIPDDRRTQLLTEAESESALLPLPKHKRQPIGGTVRDVTAAVIDNDDVTAIVGEDDAGVETLFSDNEGRDSGG